MVNSMFEGRLSLYLIPAEYYGDLESGQTLACIDGDLVTVEDDYQDRTSANYIDNDQRAGCLAYGVLIVK